MRVKGVNYNLNGKLYDTTGVNTDGSMTQASITSELEDAKDLANSAYALAEQVHEEGKTVIEGNVSNNPDEEDLTSVVDEQTGLGELKLKDRAYIPVENTKGYVILRKETSLALQLTQENTIYEIRYNFDLNGSDVTVPSGCVLKFNGGSIINSDNAGSLVLNSTSIEGSAKISTSLTGTVFNTYIKSSWFSDVHLAADNARSLSCGLIVDESITLGNSLNLFDIAYLTIEKDITNTSDKIVEIGYDSTKTPANKIEFIGKVDYINMLGGKDLNVTITSCNTFNMIANSATAGKTSIAYCNIQLGDMQNFTIQGVNNGWINENTFMKGRIRKSFTINGDVYEHNNNVFYGLVIEGSSGGTTVYFNKASYNTLYDARLETSSTNTLSITFSKDSSNNKIFRNWLNTSDSFQRRYLNYYTNNGHSSNGVFYGEDCFVKQWTISKNDYISHRELGKVSLRENGAVRYETNEPHLILDIFPKTDFGLFLTTSVTGLFYMRIQFIDNNDAYIEDLTDVDSSSKSQYIKINGGFDVSTYGGHTTYIQNNNDNYVAFAVKVALINRKLAELDSSAQTPRTLKKVIITFIPNNVRKAFRTIDIRLLQNPNYLQNNECILTLPFKTPTNVTGKKTVITDDAFPSNAPSYYLFDGESCYSRTLNVIFTRVGDKIREIDNTLNHWTVDKSTYVNHRKLNEVSLQDSNEIRYDIAASVIHSKVNIIGDNYAVLKAHCNVAGFFVTTVIIYDANGDKIEKNLTSYMFWNDSTLAYNSTGFYYRKENGGDYKDVMIGFDIPGMNTDLSSLSVDDANKKKVGRIVVLFYQKYIRSKFVSMSFETIQVTGTYRSYLELPLRKEAIYYGGTPNIANDTLPAAAPSYYIVDNEITYDLANNIKYTRNDTTLVKQLYEADVSRYGTFANVPASTDIYTGFEYFCTDRQTVEGTTDGIMIYHKGNNVWVDALGRVIS